MDFFVDKNTDLMRSTFMAVGLAELLVRIPAANTGQDVTITDMGSCYQIHSAVPLETLSAQVQEAGTLPAILPAIFKPLTAKEKKLTEEGTSKENLLLKYVPRGYRGVTIDYGAEKETYELARKAKSKKNSTREEGAVVESSPDYPTWAHLCSYFGKGSAMRVGYPALVHTWHAHQGDAAAALWELVCSTFADFPNASEDARYTWDTQFLPHLDYPDYALSTDISTSSSVSPSAVQGVSNAVGNSALSENPLKTFWLEMYFAFTGFMEVALPYNLGADVTTFYPIPRQISIRRLKDMVHEHRKSGAGRSLYSYSNQMSRAKLDILATVTFYRAMTEHLYNALRREQRGKADLRSISGFVGYYYKNIATQIPFDETVFARPAWLPLEADTDQLQQAANVLDEHRQLIERIRGRAPKYQLTGSELALFQPYRRYLALGNVEDWIAFTIAYGFYRFRHMPDQPGLRHLSDSLFKDSFPMTHNQPDRMDFRPIMDPERHPGFHRIAEAINQCTVYARYKNDVQRDSTFRFKTRHGLGDDLLRNAHNPSQFLADLAHFIHDYQRESVSVQADAGKSRTAIQPEDLQDITDLIAEYGSKVVAHMLVASGYTSRFYGKASE